MSLKENPSLRQFTTIY